MLSYWIDLGFSFLEPSTISWRFPIAFQIVLAVFILCIIPGLPESPRWLVLKGREDEALDVLCALNELPAEDKKVQTEFQAVKDTVLEMSRGGFRDCFKMNQSRNFHRTALAYVNQMFQQVGHLVTLTDIFCGLVLKSFLRSPASTSSPTTPPPSSSRTLVFQAFSVVYSLHAMAQSIGSHLSSLSS
jgi:hypothetical protein